MKKLTVSFTLLLVVCLNVMSQRVIKIDSIGKKVGNNIELFHNDTVFIYRYRGLSQSKVIAGTTVTINQPTKRIKRYYLSLNQ